MFFGTCGTDRGTVPRFARLFAICRKSLRCCLCGPKVRRVSSRGSGSAPCNGERTAAPGTDAPKKPAPKVAGGSAVSQENRGRDWLRFEDVGLRIISVFRASPPATFGAGFYLEPGSGGCAAIEIAAYRPANHPADLRPGRQQEQLRLRKELPASPFPLFRHLDPIA